MANKVAVSIAEHYIKHDIPCAVAMFAGDKPCECRRDFHREHLALAIEKALDAEREATAICAAAILTRPPDTLAEACNIDRVIRRRLEDVDE